MSIVVDSSELVSQANTAAGSEDGRQQENSAKERSMVLALSHVTPQQETALRALAAGRPLGEVAAEAGVDRGTLYRWRTRDPQFRAALKGWRAQTQAHSRDRLLALADKAIAAVQAGLEKGDANLGLRVLQHLQRDKEADPGETSPEEPEGDIPAGAKSMPMPGALTPGQLEQAAQRLAEEEAAGNEPWRKAVAELERAFGL